MFANLIKLYQILAPYSFAYSVFIPLGFIGVYRWLQYLVKIIACIFYKPIKPLPKSQRKYISSRDVTVVVPTIDHDDRLILALKSWLGADPYEVIIVTVPEIKPYLEELAKKVDPSMSRVRILTIPKGNKRKQMVVGIEETKTPILVFCDDDVLWPKTMLEWCLAPFEDEEVGAVGSSQWVIPDGNYMTIWEILASFRMSMRNIEIRASTAIDGGVSCLSGRTACYRTSIVKDPSFIDAFLHEYWLGKYHCHSGDDKFLTRWVQFHRWRTFIQACPEVELLTSFKPNYRFLIQLLRWTRNTWRSDIKALIYERQLWTMSPFTAYTMLDRFLNPLTLIYGICYFFVRITHPISTHIPQINILFTYFIWYLLIRLIKYIPHLLRRPHDIFALPIFVGFQYIFIFMKIYCLFTLHVTEWGTRAGAESDDSKEVTKSDTKGTVARANVAPKEGSPRKRARSPKKQTVPATAIMV